MSHTITTYDATILNHHAKSGDVVEFGRTLDYLAQREGQRNPTVLIGRISSSWQRTRPVTTSSTRQPSQFRPVPLDVNRNVQFHEPHPRGKVPFPAAPRLGRRLNRAYEWNVDILMLRAPHFLVKTRHLRPHVNGAQQEGGESLADQAQNVNDNQLRSSFEITGCLPPNKINAPPQAVAYDQLGLRLDGTPSCALAPELSRELILTYGIRKSKCKCQPVVTAFCAGGVAGAVSRTVVSPLEHLKIVFQIQSAGREEYKLDILVSNSTVGEDDSSSSSLTIGHGWSTTACESGSAPAAPKAAAGGGFSSLTTREQEILAKAMACLKAAPSLLRPWDSDGDNSADEGVPELGEREVLTFALSDIPLDEARPAADEALNTVRRSAKEDFGDGELERESNEVYVTAYRPKYLT
ncbi:hypothetical protein INS49_010452 [Diaporthe citri]|uniref:uncharacterized protein n=1 Tax=Diaporthe citri TaxID=83186 RepID=UPI001C81FAE6|nr:uncharacterized protein INS49_010452 [Diaporthe citri]KAG6362222.1 hypothetical protein INS49_010452 [Diaporthe citri]